MAALKEYITFAFSARCSDTHLVALVRTLLQSSGVSVPVVLAARVRAIDPGWR